MKNFYPEQKQQIIDFLEGYRDDFSRGSGIRPDSDDVLRTLINFTVRGKMLRGRLIRLGHDLFSDKACPDAVAAGAAVEMLQSALLIHDDIMDNDEIRRGEPSIYSMYAGILGSARAAGPDAADAGKALAICAGDIAFFAAVEMLQSMTAAPEISAEIISLCAREMIYVGMGQMQDVYSVFVPESMTAEKIFELYRIKTGRYTFSLPLMIGARLAGADSGSMELLSDIGEGLGIVFQIKDDELGLFSSSDITGKPVGSDIRQGKVTLFISRLMEKACDADKKRLLEIFARPDAEDTEIQEIINLMNSYGIRDDVDVITEQMADETGGKIMQLEKTSDAARAVLMNISEFNRTRIR